MPGNQIDVGISTDIVPAGNFLSKADVEQMMKTGACSRFGLTTIVRWRWAMTETSVVIITGANNGIGFHMARTLAAQGYRVAGFDLAGDNLATLDPEHVAYLPCDVTDGAAVRQAVADVLARWGQIDILVNNACLALFRPFVERNPDEIRGEFEVNYFGYLNLIAAVLPHMRARGRGIIHNVSSGVGFTGFPGMSGYTSTKGAIEGLTRTLALELAGTGVTVNVMHPPLTRTKSASPMGVPVEAMADPAVVGERLARRIRSTRPFVAPDFPTLAGVVMSRWFPVALGKFIAGLAARSRSTK
jgi:NAD(P)-dependent dehydrogenase (short-subunit alcohol dehydrogenase family)